VARALACPIVALTVWLNLSWPVTRIAGCNRGSRVVLSVGGPSGCLPGTGINFTGTNGGHTRKKNKKPVAKDTEANLFTKNVCPLTFARRLVNLFPPPKRRRGCELGELGRTTFWRLPRNRPRASPACEVPVKNSLRQAPFGMRRPASDQVVSLDCGTHFSRFKDTLPSFDCFGTTSRFPKCGDFLTCLGTTGVRDRG